MAGPAAARTLPCAACTTRPITASSCSISAAAGKSTPDASLRRQHHLASRRRHGAVARSISGSSAGSCAAAPGARPWRWPMRSAIPSGSASWSCAAFSRCAASSSNGSTRRAAAASFPMPGKPIASPIPPAERGDMIAAYYRRLTGADPAERLRCARAWSQWEGATISLLPDPARVAQLRRRPVRPHLRIDRVPLFRSWRLSSSATAS